MRIVHLTTEFPWPATSGGRVRTLAQLRLLASLPEIDRITVVSVSEHTVTPAECDALADAIPRLTVLPPVLHPVHLWRSPSHIPRVLALRLCHVPYLAAKWDSAALRRTLCEALRASSADIVYVDHLGMARYLPDIRAVRPRSRVVLEQHNVESEFFRQFAESRFGLRKQVARAEWRAAARFEEEALTSVDAVIAISRADADYFDRVARVPAHVVPVVADVERRIRPHPGRPHFCYVGSLRWRPNVAGLDWLCQSAWPHIRARISDATLEIAGVGLARDARGRLQIPGAWNVPGVETVGFAANLEPMYDRSLGMLAPVFGGSGVRIKILAGLGAGLPIVTTPDGAAGLSLSDGKEVLIASDPKDFAERVERLVHDGHLRARLRDEGYTYLETRHSPRVAQRALRSALGLPEESPVAN